MKNYLSFLTLSSCLAVCAFLPAKAADATAADKAFVMKAAQGGMTEVAAGQIAAEKGTSQDVKDFGSKMVADHSKNNDDLKALATSKGIMLPDKLDAKHQAMIDKLNGAAPADFDKAYIMNQVKGHKAMDALMTKEASSGDDADLKTFAAKTDETVKMHLSMAQDIQGKMAK